MTRRHRSTEKMAATAAAIALAAVAPALVVLDRWFGLELSGPGLRRILCAVPSLCFSAWPSYFLIVLVMTVCVCALVWGVGADPVERLEPGNYRSPRTVPRRWARPAAWGLFALASIGTLTGVWSLRSGRGEAGIYFSLAWLAYFATCVLWESKWPRLSARRHADWRLALGYALGIAAVSGMLFDLTSHGRMGALSGVLIFAAAAVLFAVRRKVSAGFWMLLAALALYSVRLSDPLFSFVGDEYSFFNAARFIAEQSSLREIISQLTDGTLVYESHPYLSSALQAISVKLFDARGFGWRYSSVAASALSIPFFFHFFRTFLGDRIAALGAFLIVASHYLISFSRIGYNSTQALLAMAFAMAAAAGVVRDPQRFRWVLTGAAIGFCFYVFPGALYVPPVALLLILWYRPPWNPAHRMGWGILLLTSLVLIVPLLFQGDYWAAKFPGTLLQPEGGSNGNGGLLGHVVRQFAYAGYSFVFAVQESHFVAASHVDPVTSALIFIGIGVLVRLASSDKFARYVLASLFLLAFFVGATHQFALPPNTRMFLLVPWYALVAAIGLGWILQRVGERRGSWPGGAGLAAAFGLLVVALNLYQSFAINVRRTPCCSFITGFMQLTHNLERTTGHEAIVLVNAADQTDISLLETVAQVGYVESPITNLPMQAHDTSRLEADLARHDMVVVLANGLSEADRRASEGALARQGYTECRLTPRPGSSTEVAWSSSLRPEVCSSIQGDQRAQWSWAWPIVASAGAGIIASHLGVRVSHRTESDAAGAAKHRTGDRARQGTIASKKLAPSRRKRHR